MKSFLIFMSGGVVASAVTTYGLVRFFGEEATLDAIKNRVHQGMDRVMDWTTPSRTAYHHCVQSDKEKV